MFENIKDETKRNFCQNAWDPISQIVNFDEKLIKRKVLVGAEYELEWCEEEILKSKEVFKVFSAHCLEYFPINDLLTLQQYASSFIGNINGIMQLRPSDDGAPSNFTAYKNYFKDRELHTVAELRNHLSLATTLYFLSSGEKKFLDTQIANSVEQFESTTNEYKQVVSEKTKFIEDIQENILNKYQEVCNLVADKTIEKQSDNFSIQSDNAKRHAGYWLFASICMSAALCSLPFLFLLDNVNSMFKGVSNEQAILSKSMIFAIVAYGLMQCVKSWNAGRHNQIINTQRANSLKTFKILADAVSSQESKDAILSKAVDSIFAHQETGFIKNTTPAPPGGQAVELFQKFVGSN